MFENISAFRMSAAMAKHAGQRQAIVAQNIANADTPGYVARDLPSFRTIYAHNEDVNRRADVSLRASRGGHLYGMQDGTSRAEPFEVDSAASPNENQVSLETEMLKSVGAKREHDRAIAIYQTALTVLRSALRSN